MENNEELLEEIEDVDEKEEQTTQAANNQIDNMLDQAMDNTSILPQSNNSAENIATQVDNNSTVDNTVASTNLDYNEPKKSKTVIIVILSVLLLLDIIALVIYLIGIDKLGFIR